NNNSGTPELVVGSESEKNKEKDVSGDDNVTEYEKTAPEGENLVDLDNVETDEDPQPKQVKKRVGRRLRSRTTQPTSSTKVTPVVTKKAKDSSVKPVRYGA
ncbi:hypothetical protein A2U01_0071858, partial [Trifolium medium]|nr:hypothetical protein [Trifolium medium]